MPQIEYDNFCNNNFFATLQIEPLKISKGENTRYISVTSRPQDFGLLYFEKKEFGIGRVWKDVSVTIISHVHSSACRESNALLWLRNMGQKDAITPFSGAVRSSVLIRVKELNPFNSGLDHMRSFERNGTVQG